MLEEELETRFMDLEMKLKGSKMMFVENTTMFKVKSTELMEEKMKSGAGKTMSKEKKILLKEEIME